MGSEGGGQKQKKQTTTRMLGVVPVTPPTACVPSKEAATRPAQAGAVVLPHLPAANPQAVSKGEECANVHAIPAHLRAPPPPPPPLRSPGRSSGAEERPGPAPDRRGVPNFHTQAETKADFVFLRRVVRRRSGGQDVCRRENRRLHRIPKNPRSSRFRESPETTGRGGSGVLGRDQLCRAIQGTSVRPTPCRAVATAVSDLHVCEKQQVADT